MGKNMYSLRTVQKDPAKTVPAVPTIIPWICNKSYHVKIAFDPA